MTMILAGSPPSIKISADDVVRFQEDGIKVKLNGTWTSVTVEGNVYDELIEFAGAATVGAFGTALVFDTSGNLYWAIANYYTGSSYNTNSYVYKITPGGQISTFAARATYGAWGTALAFDTSGNLYWAVGNERSDSSYSQTSYIYKITPGGTVTTFVSQSTTGASETALAFDTSGNLYWAIGNHYTGSSYNTTSYVYKITPAGSASVLNSVATYGCIGTALVFDTSGNLYWAVCNYSKNDGTTYNHTSYVYKITPDQTKTIFASQATNGAGGTDLIFGADGNLYWAVSNYYDGTTYNQTSYVYKITLAGTKTTFASQATNGAYGQNALAFDTSGNLYWAVTQYGTSTFGNIVNNIFKITSNEIKIPFASQLAQSTMGTDLIFDTSGNLYWAVLNYRETQYQVRNLNSYIYEKCLIANAT